MNYVNKQETIGRNLFASFLDQTKNVIEYSFTENQYDRADGHFKYENGNAIFEIKVRDESAIKYDTHFMEVDKYEYLTNSEYNKKYYVNFFGNNMLIYDLDRVNIREKSLTRYNPMNGYDTGVVYELQASDANRFRLENNKWVK